jgi:methylglutaconyl-CoA hydratase
MDKTQQGNVNFELDHGIGVLTFFHPAHNALPSHLLSKMVAFIQDAGAQEAVKAIIIKSEGDRTFCAGASLDELLQLENETQATQFFMGFANLINAIRQCPKLVLGRVQGKAIGGGVGLAAAVDYCFATPYASVRLSELSIGFGPFVIEPAVSRKIGVAATAHLTLNPTAWQTAQWAKERNLFAEVFKDTTQMDDYITHFTTSLVEYSSEAMQAIKQALWADTSHWNELLAERATISGKLAISDFTKRKLAQFKEK